MASRNRELLKSAILLIGSFTFGYNASKFLHELGHAIAYWATGATVERIIIHPFSWSYCIPGSVSEYPIFTTWGGVVFGTLMGLLLVAAIWRWRGPYVMVVLITGVIICMRSGLYLIVDWLAGSGGDACALINYGTPKDVIILLGLFMVATGIFLVGISLPALGISSSDGVKARVLVLGAGLLPHLSAKLIYNWRYNIEEFGFWATYGVAGAVFVLLLAPLSAAIHRRVRWFRDAEVKKVTWPAVALANSCAFVLLSIIFILLAYNKPKTTTKYSLTYYDRQSNFAGIHRKITYNPTAAPGKHYEYESVIFWNYDGRKGKTDITYLTRLAAIRPDTNEIIVQTILGVLIVPMDEGPHRWAFKQDGLFLHSQWAVSRDGCKVLVYGLDPNLRKYVLIALDTSNDSTTKFVIPETPWEIIFVDNNTAVASVGQDLIKVEFAESGDHKFSLDTGAAKQGAAKAVYKGEFVFHYPLFWTEENAHQHTIQCDSMKILFTDPLRFVLASKSYIWAIDTKGHVFRLNSDGSKLCIGTYAPETMIGRGTFDDSLWIAFLDGTVTVHGDSTKETAKIELP